MHEAFFPLRVLSPLGTVFESKAKAMTLPAVDGEITVLAGHMPLVSALSEGELRVLTEKGEVSIAIAGGFLRVREDGVTVLSDFAAEADSIEIARVEAAKRRAEQLLGEKKERKDIALIERDLQRALLQLKVARNVRRRRQP